MYVRTKYFDGIVIDAVVTAVFDGVVSDAIVKYKCDDDNNEFEGKWYWNFKYYFSISDKGIFFELKL